MATSEPVDFVFLDSANRPWRVANREWPEHENKPLETWIFSWSCYDRWVPLREATGADTSFEEGSVRIMPSWEADLYHALSRSHE